jgi:hypothetical protein
MMKDSYLMFFLLIQIVEFLLLLLILLGGYRVYSLYSIANIKPGSHQAEEAITSEAQASHLPLQQKTKKNPNEVLDDYIGNFF